MVWEMAHAYPYTLVAFLSFALLFLFAFSLKSKSCEFFASAHQDPSSHSLLAAFNGHRYIKEKINLGSLLCLSCHPVSGPTYV